VKNALQAVLDRAAQEAPAAAPPKPKATRKRSRHHAAARAVEALPRDEPTAEVAATVPRFHRPSREDKRLVAGHFNPKVAKQLKLLAVEDDTTVQALLEEALDLLFAKKGRARISELLKP
jgi:hypothetical protein